MEAPQIEWPLNLADSISPTWNEAMAWGLRSGRVDFPKSCGNHLAPLVPRILRELPTNLSCSLGVIGGLHLLGEVYFNARSPQRSFSL